MAAAPQNQVTQYAMKVGQALRDHIWLWFLPTIGFTLIASFYAVLRQPTWQARQALVVRDEAGGSASRQGRFDSVDTMKTAQETILEVARSKPVVESALKTLGQPKSFWTSRPWPGRRDIERFQRTISVNAPQGAEFGRTEVIYLSVTGPSPEEAVQRTGTVRDHLQVYLGELRRARAQSLIKELEQAAELAEGDLDLAATRLQKMEASVGPDLGELRNLNDAGSAEGNLQHSLNQVKQEIRQAQAARQANTKLRELLQRAEKDPNQFLATPSRLLESQPALRRLKEGLVDAQLRTSKLLGHMTEAHPQVMAAVRAEEQVHRSLHAELATALVGVETDLQVGQSQLADLQEQQKSFQGRLDRLAGVRVRYHKLVDDLRQQTELLRKAKESLADARAKQTAARQASLLTPFQGVEVGSDPVGPSRKAIVAVGFFGGLATGLGLVLLTIPGSPTEGRRWSDYIGFGRRASDRAGQGRRSEDRPPSSPLPTEAGGANRRAEDRQGNPNTDRRGGSRRTEERSAPVHDSAV